MTDTNKCYHCGQTFGKQDFRFTYCMYCKQPQELANSSEEM